ncbi:MAG: prepilin-type N-terminal cleavage/methylation domain-containing protein [Maricaulaceae bacterium]
MTRRADGFTVLETLIALAILGVSFAGLFAVLGQAPLRAERAARTLAATSLAQTLLAEAQAGALDAPSGLRDGFAWRVEVRAARLDADAAVLDRLAQLEAVVSDPDEARVIARLSTLTLRAAP